jgi:HEAT repeat protein
VLTGQSDTGRRYAAKALVKIGAPAVHLLIEKMWGSTGKQHKVVAEALLKIGECAIEPLIQVLRHSSHPGYQLYAAWALGKLGDTRAVEPLSEVIRSYDKDVALAAVNALGKIGNLHAFKALLKYDSPWDRWGLDRKVRDKIWHIVNYSVFSDSFDLARAAIEDQNMDVRRKAVEILSKLGDARAVETLLGVLRDSGSLVQYEIKEAMVRIGSSAVEPLIEALRDPDERVRSSAISALGKLGTAAKDAIPALTKALEDNDPHVRTAAAEALQKIQKGSSQTTDS